MSGQAWRLLLYSTCCCGICYIQTVGNQAQSSPIFCTFWLCLSAPFCGQEDLRQGWHPGGSWSYLKLLDTVATYIKVYHIWMHVFTKKRINTKWHKYHTKKEYLKIHKNCECIWTCLHNVLSKARLRFFLRLSYQGNEWLDIQIAYAHTHIYIYIYKYTKCKQINMYIYTYSHNHPCKPLYYTNRIWQETRGKDGKSMELSESFVCLQRDQSSRRSGILPLCDTWPRKKETSTWFGLLARNVQSYNLNKTHQNITIEINLQQCLSFLEIYLWNYIYIHTLNMSKHYLYNYIYIYMCSYVMPSKSTYIHLLSEGLRFCNPQQEAVMSVAP